MPKFIYTITILVIANITGLYFVITQLSPHGDINKLIFSVLITLTMGLIIPLISTVVNYVFKSNKEDLNQHFKNSFKRNLMLVIFIGTLVFLKIKFLLDYKVIILIFILTILVFYAYPKLRKPIKKSKY